MFARHGGFRPPGELIGYPAGTGHVHGSAAEMADGGWGSRQGQAGPPKVHPGGETDSQRDAANGRHRAHRQPEGRARRSRRSRRGDSGRDAGKRGSFFRELPVLVIVALGLALLIKAFVIQAFYIPSASMENTLLIGDRVLVNKLAYDLHGVHRGDIVVFNGAGSFIPAAPESKPDNPVEAVGRAIGTAFGVTAPGEKDFIKRVIGVPGDHVACCDERGRVTVNGVALNGEPYLHPGDVPSETDFEATVPPGRVWVMGDHRSVSADSRAHVGDPGGGTIPIDKILGRAFAVVWPPSHMKVLSPPRTFEQPSLAAGETRSAAGDQSGEYRPDAVPAGSAAAAGVFPLAAGSRYRTRRGRCYRGQAALRRMRQT